MTLSPLLLQINDSLFPIGGYAHSYGLESYIQKGIVHDVSSASEYLEKKLRYSILYSDLLPARLSMEAAARRDLETVLRIDTIVTASKSPSELRSASRKLGARFAKTVGSFPNLNIDPIWDRYQTASGGNGNYSVCYGVFCAACHLPQSDALSAFLYTQASAITTCCVKSIPLRQTDGQILLFQVHPLLQELLETVQVTEESMLCLSTPGFDLRSMQHETLYSRIYMS